MLRYQINDRIDTIVDKEQSRDCIADKPRLLVDQTRQPVPGCKGQKEHQRNGAKLEQQSHFAFTGRRC